MRAVNFPGGFPGRARFAAEAAGYWLTAGFESAIARG